MSIVLVSGDLMLCVKLDLVARSLNQTLDMAGTIESALESAALSGCRLFIVDLDLPGLNLDLLFNKGRRIFQEDIQVIAYAPHVRTEKLAAAREAGCDLVVSRGQIMSDAESILRRFLDTDKPQN